MKRSKRIALLIAAVLTVVGLTVMFFSVLAVGFDWSRLDSIEYVGKTHTVTEDFTQIDIDLDTSDLRFALAEDGVCRVECYENEKTPHSVAVEGAALVIRETDERAWYDHIGFQFEKAEVTVYLPETAYDRLKIVSDTSNVTVPEGFAFSAVEITLSTGDAAFYAAVGDCLSIKTTTGDVTVADIDIRHTATLTTETGEITLQSVTVPTLCFETDTGYTTIANVNCEALAGNSDTGKISLENVIVTGHIKLESDTGDIEFIRCDAATLHIQSSTGNVAGTLLSDKSFQTDTSTGAVDIKPYGTAGGLCVIITSTGDITIRIEK